MDTSSAQSVWELLKTITDETGNGRLADVSRFVSFRPYETYGPHRHRRIEINYVKKGNCILQLDNESVGFNRDEMMIIGPEVSHRFEAGPDGATLMQLEFLPDIFAPAGSTAHAIFSDDNRLVRIAGNVRIVRAVQQIINELEQRKEHYRPLALLYYTELLILLNRYMDETYLPLCSDRAMKAAISFIRTRYASDITIADTALAAGVSSRYLRKLFDRYLNTSPQEYLTQVRVNRAIELLRNTELSVKEVSFSCGFRSPQYFSRVFKRQTGRLPKSMTIG